MFPWNNFVFPRGSKNRMGHFFLGHFYFYVRHKKMLPFKISVKKVNKSETSEFCEYFLSSKACGALCDDVGGGACAFLTSTLEFRNQLIHK